VCVAARAVRPGTLHSDAVVLSSAEMDVDRANAIVAAPKREGRALGRACLRVSCVSATGLPPTGARALRHGARPIEVNIP